MVLTSGRHEAVDLQNVPVNRASACDWKRIRHVMHESMKLRLVRLSLVPQCPRPGFMTGASMAIVLVCGVPRLALGTIFAGVVLPPRLNPECVPAMLSEILQKSYTIWPWSNKRSGSTGIDPDNCRLCSLACFINCLWPCSAPAHCKIYPLVGAT